MAIRQDVQGFPLSGVPILTDSGDNFCLNTLYRFPLKPAGYIVDYVGASRLGTVLITAAGAMSSITTIGASGTVTLSSATAPLTMTGDTAVLSMTGTNAAITMTGLNASVGTNTLRIRRGFFKDLETTNLPTVQGQPLVQVGDLVNYLKLDQTAQQEVINGTGPAFTSGFTVSEGAYAYFGDSNNGVYSGSANYISVFAGGGSLGVVELSGYSVSINVQNALVMNTAANTDLLLNFAGTSNSGSLTWMEDEDCFYFADDTGFGISDARGLLHVSTATYALTAYFERTTAVTNAIYTAQRVISTTSGSMADGFGTAIAFLIRDDGATDNTGALFGAVRNGADNSADVVLYNYSGGSGSEKHRWTKDGVYLIGSATELSTGVKLQIKVNSTSPSVGLHIENSAASGTTAGSGFVVGSNDGAALADTDRLGYNLFGGYDGAAFRNGAGIVAYADGAWASGAAPTRISFETCPAASVTRAERMSIYANGTIRLGTVATNYSLFGANGDQSFVGTAGFYPRALNQALEPAAGTGATELDTGEMCIWTDSDDSKCYLCYNHGGTVKTVELA